MKKEQERILSSTDAKYEQFVRFQSVIKDRMANLQAKLRVYSESRKEGIAKQHNRLKRIVELGQSIKSPF